MKFFNTAGPVNRANHYKLDPLHRWDLEEILFLIEQEKYFILHAPRQTGKTSSLLALQEFLNKEEKYTAIYINVEAGQAARNDVARGMKAILSELYRSAKEFIDLDFTINEIIEKSGHEDALNATLSALCNLSEKPVLIFIDEIDALIGDTLISVLRQIRAGYYKRPANFPLSILLCGVRDIKDYRIHRSDDDIITGGSAFNIKAESLRLGNFTKEDIIKLYNEHTKETGQKFNDDIFDLIWNYTEGQPWLVNALAYELTFKMKENRDRTISITKDMAEQAKNRLILSRSTHLGQLSDKLEESRVRRVILPMILNEDARTNKDDEEYCIDLGLITLTKRGLAISNEIYKEIIPRELTDTRQVDFLNRFAPEWVNKDGFIDTDNLFLMFTDFWRENSDIWASHIAGYEEAAPHLVFQAFLQRVANGKGFIAREYGLGRGRTDLMLKWKHDGKEQRIVIELKVMRKKDSYETVKKKALEQTAEYTQKCSGDESHIIVFDRDDKTDWREKVFTENAMLDGMTFKIWGV